MGILGIPRTARRKVEKLFSKPSNSCALASLTHVATGIPIPVRVLVLKPTSEQVLIEVLK